MSYETNPISNRLKINKGWKNPMFPVQTLNYSRDMLLWFKVYLFLKVYLLVRRIKLLACEIRISENHTKILYLSVIKQMKKKKKGWKSKWKSKSVLENCKSPLLKAQNKKARFLLYQDLQTLKKNSPLFLNRWQKKNLSHIWMAKPRFSSWINASHSIYSFRKKTRIYQDRSTKKKRMLNIVAKNIFSKDNVFPREKETLRFHQCSYDLEQTFWTNKQTKKILNLLIRNKKELIFLKKSLDIIRYIQKTQTLFRIETLIHNLHFKYQQKKRFLKEWRKIFQFWIIIHAETTQKTDTDLFSKNIDHQKTKKHLINFLRNLKKKLWLLHTKSIFFKNKPQLFSLIKNIFFTQSHHRGFLIPQNPRIWNGILTIFLALHSISFKSNNSFHPKIFTPANKVRKNMPLNAIIRYVSKLRNLSLISRSFFKKRRKKLLTLLARLVRFKFKRQNFKKTNYKLKRKTFQYRINYRQMYRNSLVFLTNFKLKHLIQDLVQHYFAVPVYVKLSWPLADFKNLKFYRLVFPKKSSFHYENLKFKWMHNSNTKVLKKRYLYVGKMTKHIKFMTDFSKKKDKKYVLRKLLNTRLKQDTGTKKVSKLISQKLSKPRKQKKYLFNRKKLLASQKDQLVRLQLKSNFLFSLKGNTKSPKTKQRWHVHFHLSKKKMKQKNAYLKLKAKTIQKQSEHRLHWGSKANFMPNIIPALTLFSKYLDPQMFAEQLAKILENTKRHSSTLKVIETALRTIHMHRGIGYRIALIGRADGANKSRIIYLRKSNRSRSRQVFMKNVNFGMSQARATIGAFGVKVWIYY